MTERSASLHCSHITISFDGTQALVDVELVFPMNGCIAIIGPNGAGKTTLLNAITGFVGTQKGRIFYGVTEITHLAPHRIARFGIARSFQHPRLIKQLSVLANVLLGCAKKPEEGLAAALFRFRVDEREARNRLAAKRLLDFVGLGGKATQQASDLSYGEQKLLALACCLALEAKLLLLDEPVAGVSPEMAAKLLSLLKELRDAGHLIIFIEHDLTFVRQLADLVIVMDQGKVIAQGEPGEVLDRPEILDIFVGRLNR